MSLEEELRVSFKEPLSLIVTLIVIIVYLGLLLAYNFNDPRPTLFNMSPPLLYALLLWIVLSISVIIAAWRIWR